MDVAPSCRSKKGEIITKKHFKRLTVSVVIPVKNGSEYLDEVLQSVLSQKIEANLEVIAVDSGSTDGSLGIIDRYPVEIIEIDPSDFGHGKTRNIAVERSSGDFIAFLTQDATPTGDRWLSSFINSFNLDERVGAAFGPHLPRQDASPMISNELNKFFVSMSSNGHVTIKKIDNLDGSPDDYFLSNVNSCISRECWESVGGFQDLPYAEDQAFARDVIDNGWSKVFQPQASVYHSHNYGIKEFARRYFDEYRGLRDAHGHIKPFNVRNMIRDAIALTKSDIIYMRHNQYKFSRTLPWAFRSIIHHMMRELFSILGSRSNIFPPSIQRFLSLEKRDDGNMHVISEPRVIAASYSGHGNQQFKFILDNSKSIKAVLAPPISAERIDGPLHIAWVIPPFSKSSGGLMTIFNIINILERDGHCCTLWVHDPKSKTPEPVAKTKADISEVSEIDAPVFNDFDNWFGADVTVATAWQTAYVVDTLPYSSLKVYFVQDYEPDFYAQSDERLWAEGSYKMGFPCVCASPWLADLIRKKYKSDTYSFHLGVDSDIYFPQDIKRDDDLVVFYSRQATPRRGVNMGMLALEEVHARRPQTKFALFGWKKPPNTSAPFDFYGVASAQDLACLYNRSSVGLNISLTNYSRIPNEMMACGLPVLELKGFSAESVYGSDGSVIDLAEPNPLSIADSIVSLLDNPDRSAMLSKAGKDFVKPFTWEKAADTIMKSIRALCTKRLK